MGGVDVAGLSSTCCRCPHLEDLTKAPFAHDSLDPQLLGRQRLRHNLEPRDAVVRGAMRRTVSHPPHGRAAVP